ncbi:MAG TPA: DUF58 domain-containing protein [Pirellulales bacterium]|nr:DUF58 domain-containing protein [Pirellulales bacterium]
MPDSKRFLHPETIQRIGRLDVRARYIVEGFLSGSHRSPYFGQSVEFLQHREYTRGDDMRRIDWKVWAKQDRYYIKQYEEDTNLRATLVVDVSSSMRYGSGAMTKYEYGCTLATSLAWLLLRQQDAVGCMSFDSAPRVSVPFRTAHSHLNAVIKALEVSEPREKTDLGATLRKVAETYPGRGMIVLVSDLLVERDSLFKGLSLLRQRGHDVMLFHLLDDHELDFPFEGSTRFEALESADRVTCNPRALRQGYLKSLHAYLDEVRRGCARNTVDYALVRTSQPLDVSLTAFLAARAA